MVIRRLNEIDDKSYTDKIDVSFHYSPKQRIIYDMTNTNQHIQVPTMCIHMSNLQFDKDRTFNKISGFTVSEQTLSGGGRFPQPVPVKFTMPFSILSRFQRDMDQIITCIFSNFYPYIVISYKHPDLEHEVRCVVQWEGGVNFTYPIDVPANVTYRIVADSSFTVLGWIYKNASNPWGIIYNIPTTFTAVSNIYDDYFTMKAMEDTIVTDSKVVSGRPQLFNISPYYTNIGVSSQSFDIVGDMFQFVNGLAISANDSVYMSSAYQLLNPFISSRSLSSVYPAFSGIPLLSSDWSINGERLINFTLPTPLASGNVDVMAWGSIGYGKLSFDSIRPTLNPYVSGTAEYNAYVEFQYPCVSGIEIR